MIGIAKTIKDNVQTCTSEKLNEALDSPHVAEVCRAIAQALEAHRKGEMTKEEFEATKARMKKQLPILTLHATFKNGRRKNDEAIPSGLAIYDLDHIPDPRGRWAEMEPRKEELGIVMAHISPSLEGLRLVFTVPQGMTLAEAQAWMARQLGDTHYDACVKDYARCSFAVPRGYVLWVSPFLFRSFSEEIKGDKGRYRSALGEIKADSFSGVQELKKKSSVSPCLCVPEKESIVTAIFSLLPSVFTILISPLR